MATHTNIEVTDDELDKLTAVIEIGLQTYGIKARVVEINYLQDSLQFCLELALGVTIEAIEKRQKDIAMLLASPTGAVVIQGPIPGKALVGIELPIKGRPEVDKAKFTQLKKIDPRLEPPRGLLSGFFDKAAVLAQAVADRLQ